MALILDGILFELNTESRSTAFFIHNDDDEYEFSLDCYFHANILWMKRLNRIYASMQFP